MGKGENKRIWLVALAIGLVFFLLLVIIAQFLLPAIGKMQSPPAADAAQINGAVDTFRLDTRPIIVIDAGHGGHDPGALSYDESVTEAEVNREVTQKLLEKLSAHEHELNVIVSHKEDEYVSTLQRANIAAWNYADFMLSIHLNAAYAENGEGFSCYPVPPGRVHHDDSLRFAHMLAAQAQNAGQTVLGSSGIWYAYYTQMPGGGYDKELIDEQNISAAGTRADESFAVLEYPSCPAVLAEMWFMTNPDEMAKWYTQDGMQVMAGCLYLAICEYFNITPINS